VHQPQANRIAQRFEVRHGIGQLHLNLAPRFLFLYSHL
jgi:hypothetical protein